MAEVYPPAVNVLNEEKKQQVVALGRLGWSLRRIERTPQIRRETAAAYLRAAGLPVRPAGGWGRGDPKPAIQVSTDRGHEDASGDEVRDPLTGQLLREHLRQQRGRHRIQPQDRPSKTP